MIIWFFGAVLLSLILNLIFFQYTYLGLDLHSLCQEFSPTSPHKEFYQALVCSRRLGHSDVKIQMSSIGVIHILVVSGAHLGVLNRVLKSFPRQILPTWSVQILLFTYVACCGFNWPVLRSWIQGALVDFSKRHTLYLRKGHCLLLSLFFCLVIFPQQGLSISLLLSWLAGLGISVGKNIFTRSIFCYLFLFPALLCFSPIGPWTILVNTFLTPVAALLLFPFSMLTYIFPPLKIITDLLWDLFLFVCAWLHSSLPFFTLQAVQISPLILWLYALILHFLVHRRTPS